MKLVESWDWRGPVLLVRPYLPMGRYPAVSFFHSEATLVVDGDLVYSVVRVHDRERISERPWIALEELRLLGAITLSIPSEQGMVCPCPSSFAFRLEDEVNLRDGAEVGLVGHTLRKALASVDRRWAEPNVPVTGTPGYALVENGDTVVRATEVFDAIDLTDALMMRGLGSLVKAPYLAANNSFHTEACISLHIAMEASGQVILRRLRSQSRSASYEDAGRYLSELFGEEPHGGKYFADYYEDRIKTVHPENRFGIHWDAPLAADDYFDLHYDLRSVYHALLTKVGH